MTKHLEIKTYEFYDIRVMVEINYDKALISLVERGENPDCHCDGPVMKPKNYIFIKRGLEYMNGWRNVLSAMEFAIGEAEKELQEYIKVKEKEKHDLVTDVLLQATDLVNQKRYGKKKLKNN